MCGFSDIRKNEKGQYYCSICSKVMIPQYEEIVRRSGSPEEWAQLKRQCRATRGLRDKPLS